MEREKRARHELVSRLRSERDELEHALVTRIGAIGDQQEPRDPVYLEGRRAAVSAALDYGLSGVELGDRVPLPPILLAQARLAARFGVSLDTVLRRYFAGYTLLCDFIAKAAKAAGDSHLREVLRSEAQLFDRLLTQVAEEYRREPPRVLSSPEEHRTEQVERLLAGELGEFELGYDLSGWHVAAIASEPEAIDALREAAAALDRRILEVGQQDGGSWVWLGGRRELDMPELVGELSRRLPQQVTLALGEPGEGTSGWRLSHRQARALWSVGDRCGEGITRYADAALLASMLRDDLLTDSLHQLFIKPIEGQRDDGSAVLKETLRAYFAAGRNVSSAASALRVTRHTVTNRLRAVETSLGRSLSQCSLELEVALLLEGGRDA